MLVQLAVVALVVSASPGAVVTRYRSDFLKLSPHWAAAAAERLAE